jgi:ATP-dependent protease HslVU (ClpYQ) peptidase subunit
VVAAIGSQPTVAAPDESRIVAAIGSGGEAARTAARPGAPAVTAAMAGRWRGSAALSLDRVRLALKG